MGLRSQTQLRSPKETENKRRLNQRQTIRKYGSRPWWRRRPIVGPGLSRIILRSTKKMKTHYLNRIALSLCMWIMMACGTASAQTPGVAAGDSNGDGIDDLAIRIP